MNAPQKKPLIEENWRERVTVGPLPGSHKVYVPGSDETIRVPMREVELAPTRDSNGALIENRPITVYDTSGAYTDPNASIDIHRGLEPIRLPWIERRGDTELAAMLRRDGMSVVLTRQADVFVPLEARISIARAAGADVFLSLHADALAEGVAQGATVYTLSDKASDRASALLAQRHDRADLLAGVDLAGQDDVLAAVMMDMSRTETQPRSDRLARTLAASISAAGIRMLRHPIQQAGFSVLKSPDIPSVLLEAGFLSSRSDRARLEDPEWRKSLQMAIAAALRKWAVADAAEARLIRQ